MKSEQIPNKSLSKGSVAKYLVTKYIKKDKISWGRDIKFCKYLVDKMPEVEFWQSLPDNPTFNSGMQLATPYYFDYFKEKYKHWRIKIPPTKKYKLENKPVEQNLNLE